MPAKVTINEGGAEHAREPEAAPDVVEVDGRRIRLRELDANADVLERLLWKPPQEPGRSGRLTRLRAAVVAVANVEIPAYVATVIVTTAPC